MQIKQALSLCALTLASFCSQAAHWSPHVGADIVGWGIQPTADYPPDKNPFPRINRAGNFYFGTRINGYFGVDLGFEHAQRKQRSVVFNGGEWIYAVPEVQNNSSMVTMKLNAFHMDMNFYWEAVERLELMFMMGVAYLHPGIHVYHFTYATGIFDEYRIDADVKYSGRFGFSAQYSPIPCLGIKGGIIWDQTKRIRLIGFDENNNVFQMSPYTRAMTYTLGLVYSFNNPRRSPHRIGLEMTDRPY
jgi:hypothetical protein